VKPVLRGAGDVVAAFWLHKQSTVSERLRHVAGISRRALQSSCAAAWWQRILNKQPLKGSSMCSIIDIIIHYAMKDTGAQAIIALLG
jgi:hypothetical protein